MFLFSVKFQRLRVLVWVLHFPHFPLFRRAEMVRLAGLTCLGQVLYFVNLGVLFVASVFFGLVGAF